MNEAKRKPLGNYTLTEIHNLCNTDCLCGDCPFNADCRSLFNISPKYWDADVVGD